jgi:hypothetical protein
VMIAAYFWNLTTIPLRRLKPAINESRSMFKSLC